MTIILLQAVLDTCGPATYLPAPLLLPFAVVSLEWPGALH